MSKSIWESKTFWANAVALLAAVGSIFGLDLSPEEQATLGTSLAGVMAIVNIVLRKVTHQAIR